MQSSRRILVAFHIPEALRDVLEGISDFAKHEGCKWQVECVDAHDFHTAFGKKLAAGAITALGARSKSLIDRLRRSGMPVVNVLRDAHPHLPSVLSDNVAIGRAGAAYFMQRGFTQCAFLGVDTPWSAQREEGFRRQLAKAGLPAPLTLPKLALADFEYGSNVRAVQKLRHWVRTLPRAIAAMTAADFMSRTLLTACEAELVSVPEQLAILGVDNFHTVCELASVPLSSIQQDFVAMGREAAALLHKLIEKKRSRMTGPILLPPGRLQVRKSTDTLAYEDPIVVAALKMIHEQAPTGISMKELLNEVPLCRKWLDYRFKQLVGHTPSTEIRRRRLQNVSELLIDTDMPLRQIAARGRFSCVQNLTRSFQAEYGLSPQAFRLKARGAMAPK